MALQDEVNDAAATQDVLRLPPPEKPPFSKSPPRLIVIGAGSRGAAFGKAIKESSNGICIGVAEPIALKRKLFVKNFVSNMSDTSFGQYEFERWEHFQQWELERRAKVARGEYAAEGCDGVFVCVQDKMHKAVILGLAPLGIHIMCEKPLATNLNDCVSIYRSLQGNEPSQPQQLFSIGHVLRYSPHNMLLRELLLENEVIGQIMAVNHTEPVGWWHFAHSFVRGDWRNEDTSAPSLLTKSCHDIDILLWLLCSPPPKSSKPAHVPNKISSSGALRYFHNGSKPAAAGNATNCLKCDFEPSCRYSAKKIYLGPKPPSLATGNTGWPVDVIVPDIEDYIRTGGLEAGKKAVLKRLADDYDDRTPATDISKRPWFGRCVYESDNNVCDNQTVTLTFDDMRNDDGKIVNGGKTATFNMVALTKKVCERYTNIYGTDGEIFADSSSILVHNFSTGENKTYYPHIAEGGHGAGDGGLARQFVLAIDQVKNHGVRICEAQVEYIGCSLEEVVRSHAVVFAAEEARRNQTVVDFPSWWNRITMAKAIV